MAALREDDQFNFARDCFTPTGFAMTSKVIQHGRLHTYWITEESCACAMT